MTITSRVAALERRARLDTAGDCACRGSATHIVYMLHPKAVPPPAPHCVRCRKAVARVAVSVRPAPWEDPDKPIPSPGYVVCSGLREFYALSAYDDPPEWWRTRGGSEGHTL